jgi:D-glycero-D-manno-heptose 1,7-bisphosphate phosphatase
VAGRPAVFIDRDGTIIVEREYLADPEGVELVPGATGAIRRLGEAGFALVVVTNQSGIARGYYTVADYEAVAARLEALLGEGGAVVDLTRYCPHHPEITGPCACRKPATGMFEDAARALDIDPAASFFVGDKLTDVVPALTLGGRGILVRTGYGSELEAEAPDEIEVVDDLAAAAELILNLGRR